MKQMAIRRFILDEIDRDIIRQLSADGRASLTDIGEFCGISRISVRRRINRMIDAGVIEGFTVVVNWDLVVVED